MAELDGFVKVADSADLPSGASKRVEVEDVGVLVFNLDGDYFAVEDVCTHDGAPLDSGEVVDGCQIECPRHGARFDIRTGAAVRMPAFTPVNTFEVRVDHNEIYVESPY